MAVAVLSLTVGIVRLGNKLFCLFFFGIFYLKKAKISVTKFESYQNLLFSFSSIGSKMAIESETLDISVRRRKVGNLSNQSSSSDLLNNNNNNNIDKFSDSNDSELEKDYDADTSTLNPAVTEVLQQTTEHLSHDEALNKLKEVGAKTPILASEIGTDFSFKRQIVWTNAIGFLFLHLAALVGIFMSLLGYPRVYTVLYSKYYNSSQQQHNIATEN